MLYLGSLRVHGGLPGVTAVSQILNMWHTSSYPAVKTLQNKDIRCVHCCTHKVQFSRHSSFYRDSCARVLTRKYPYSNSAFSNGCTSRSIYGCLHNQELTQQRLKCGETHTSQRAHIFTTPIQLLFYEKDAKSGYGGKKKHSRKELIREGLKELRGEIIKWKDEVREKFEDDPLFVRPGDMDKFWVLDSEESLKQWIVTSDQDHGEGFSSCSLTLSPTGHGLFSGHISTQVPKDGRIKTAGYCNMKSIRPRKSFKREVCLDWTMYTHLELRVRGDGRSYIINIATGGYFDIHWNDVYTYILHTRGGPHWQITKEK